MQFGQKIKMWRAANGLSMLDFASMTGIDQGLLSKYEAGKRLPSEKHLQKLAQAMNKSLTELRREFLVEKIYHLLENENNPFEILLAAEPRIHYLSSKQVLQLQALNDDIKVALQKIDTLHEQWKSKKPLKGIQLQKMLEFFDVHYTFDSNRIEGNTLTLQETHLVVNEGITIGGKSMREHLEAINHKEAIDFVRGMVTGTEELNKRSLLDIHRLVLKSIDNENAGRYRSIGVRISGSEHLPPDALLIPELMDDYFEFYHQNKAVMHPVILAAEMHERLVSIHPFVDGNGRTARLVMNFVLLKHGYTIAILKGDLASRLAYYQALEKVQVKNEPEDFYQLIISKVEESLKEHLALV